jgi:peptidoglycan/LPS O-acetylase OafA/YrhL
LFLVQNFGDQSTFGINASYWTIALEMQLYALYPLLILLARRFGWGRSLIGLAAIEITLRLWWSVRGLPHYVSFSPLIFWFSWSLGAYVAERHMRGTIRPIPKYSLYAIGTAAIAAAFVRPLYTMSFLLFALLTGAVVAAFLYKGEEHFPVPVALETHLQKAGLYSYSLYLWHKPFVDWVPRLVSRIAPGVHIHPLVMFAFCIMLWLFVAVPMARLSYQFCELPSISLGKFLYARAKEIHMAKRSLAAVGE